ncbi:glycoside hydrolase family 57 protein [Mangrovibacterium sp.]|uniref:glycoside hydrolase family 57 protein n=1 Tax=Mangrovibacterium sp. TaxID=1961364 RepID=UPI0035621EDC
MKSICLLFNVHQPVRLRRMRFYDIGNSDYYYDDYHNETEAKRLADSCYLRANDLIYQLIQKYPNRFKVAFSISGTAIDLFKRYTPEVLTSFQKLAATGCVEFVAQPYAHSYASVMDGGEFIRQVAKHADELESSFGKRPTVFANTKLIYTDEVGRMVAGMGYKAALINSYSVDQKNPNCVFQSSDRGPLSLLPANTAMSDDIARWFTGPQACGVPLIASDFVAGLKALPAGDGNVNLILDYENFGGRKNKNNGIFDFLKRLPSLIFKSTDFKFLMPSEVVESHQPVSELKVPETIRLDGAKTDLSAWLGNDLQREAVEILYALTAMVNQTDDADLKKDWAYLQTSDHFSFMCTRMLSEYPDRCSCGSFDSPFDAFVNYMNILSDFNIRLQHVLTTNGKRRKQLHDNRIA